MGVGVSLMKKIMEGYGYGIIQDCFGLLTVLEKEGFSKENFLNFVEKYKKKSIEKLELEIEKKRQDIPRKEVPIKNKFIAPGELEKMENVICSKCQGEIFITATCCSNPLKRQGFLRKGICGSCGNEFGIR